MSFSGLQPPPPFRGVMEAAFLASGASTRYLHTSANRRGLSCQRIFYTLSPSSPSAPTAAASHSGDDAIFILATHYKSSVNVIAARHRFHCRVQTAGEIAYEYIAALRSLVGDCGFGSFADIIRDQLVKTISHYFSNRHLLLDSVALDSASKLPVKQRSCQKRSLQ
uniref:Uncharacterized protein n=1 Tax=Amblyomma triste TaxID=251400 RepID=A0A023G3T1_AMBTT